MVKFEGFLRDDDDHEFEPLAAQSTDAFCPQHRGRRAQMATKQHTKRTRAEAAHTHLHNVWSHDPGGHVKLIAIDPGDTWTGVAFFTTDENGKWYCMDAQEFSPPEFEDALAEFLLDRDGTPPPIVVYEKWRLYADHAQEKTGSEFPTSQHIGVIKYLVRVNNDHYLKHVAAYEAGKMLSCEQRDRMCEDPTLRPHPIELVKQPADIKKPTRGILKFKGIKSVARPIANELYHKRDHVVDAELHGWKYILDTIKGEPVL